MISLEERNRPMTDVDISITVVTCSLERLLGSNPRMHDFFNK